MKNSTTENMTVEPRDKKEFVDNFGNIEALKDDGVLEKLVTLRKIFNLSSEDLYIKWEQYVNRAQEDLDLSVVSLDGLQQYLQSSIRTADLTPSAVKSGSIKKRPTMRPTGFSSSPANAPSTPSLKKRKVDPIESSPVVFETANNTFVSPNPKTDGPQVPLAAQLASHQDANTIIETLNPEIESLSGYLQLDENPETSIKPFKLASNFDNSKFKFRTMAMKLLESADVLDEQIDYMGKIYQDANKGVELGNPCLSSQTDIVCCGRIVPDSPFYDKLSNTVLNDTSLFLESSRFGGIGQRVPLDLKQLNEYSFFPGQIVVLKGSNPTGRAFSVKQVMKIPDLGSPLSTEDELQDYEQLLQGTNMKYLIASGPYCNQNTLDYLKFEALVERINKTIKPHVVLLYGPFIDIENKVVVSGDIELPNEKSQPKSLDELFKKLITPIIKKIDARIQVILIPSLKDTCIKHVSYPQDSFDRKLFGLPKNVKIFPNPSSFFVNEVMFGASNLDTYRDLKDVYKQGSTSIANRLDRVTHHIFEQRRYYPSFPGSINKAMGKTDTDEVNLHDGVMAEEVNETLVGGSSLEVPYLALSEIGDSLPDVVVIPSDLKYFAKVLNGVVVINPGRFIRPSNDPLRNPGSYAVMDIKPPAINEEDNVLRQDNGMYYHNVGKRCRVDVYNT